MLVTLRQYSDFQWYKLSPVKLIFRCITGLIGVRECKLVIFLDSALILGHACVLLVGRKEEILEKSLHTFPLLLLLSIVRVMRNILVLQNNKYISSDLHVQRDFPSVPKCKHFCLLETSSLSCYCVWWISKLFPQFYPLSLHRDTHIARGWFRSWPTK